MGDTQVKDALDAADVADYLREHPQFLGQFPDLAMQLEIPRAQGPAASLVGYQVDALRARNRELERRLAELMRVAGKNERLMVRVHAFTLGLLRAGNMTEVVRCVAAGMAEDFHTDIVRLLLFRPDDDAMQANWLVSVPGGASALPEFAAFLASDEPLIGRLAWPKLVQVFGDDAGKVRSAALVRLGDHGLLAIGSEDDNRFHPGMGGVFLQWIGEAVATALEYHGAS